MMEALRNWLLALIAVSILCAAAESLIPTGGVKTVGQLVCGLVVLCVLVQPLAALRGYSIADWLEEYAQSLQMEEEHLEKQVNSNRKTVIEDCCATYISDKAAELGTPCRVQVQCSMQADGLYLPESVQLWGDFDAVAQSRLTQLLETELGIPTDQQTYYLAKEEMP